MSDFYEAQLLRLTVVCIVSLVVENYVNKRKRGPDSRENTKLGGSSTATLMRQYLVVYAIVMGTCRCYRGGEILFIFNEF